MRIANLNRNRPISIEETLERWMFFIVNGTKSFMGPGCSVTQGPHMTHPYKLAIAAMLSGKNSFNNSYKNSYNELWRGHGILCDIITV